MKDAAAAIMAKIRMLYGADEESDQFLAFMPLGRPLTSEDLSFADAEHGIGTSAETLRAAASFAIQVNTVPVVETVWTHDGRRLWDEYETILTQAVVADEELTDEEETELAEARDLLYDEVEVTGEDGETETDTVDSEALATYREYETKYRDAKTRLNTARITAENADDPDTESEAREDVERLEAELETVEREWLAKGHRAEVRAAFADVERLTDGSPQIAWSQWKDTFERGRVTDLAVDREFFETTFWPKGFYREDAETGWTTVTMDRSEVESLRDRWRSDLPAGAGGDLLDADVQADVEIDSLSVELARVDLVRHWFAPAVLRSRVWQWRHDRDPLSDGGDPPRGSLPAYPVALVFARNLSIDLDVSDARNEAVVAALQEGGLHSLGPMLLEQVPSTERAASVRQLRSADFDPSETVAVRAAGDAAEDDAGDASERGRRDVEPPNTVLSNLASVLAKTDASGDAEPGGRLKSRPKRTFLDAVANPPASRVAAEVSRKRRSRRSDDRRRVRDHRDDDSRRRRRRGDDDSEPRVRDHRRRRNRRGGDPGPRVRDHRSDRDRHTTRARRGRNARSKRDTRSDRDYTRVPVKRGRNARSGRDRTRIPARRGRSARPVTLQGQAYETDSDSDEQLPVEGVRITFDQEGTGLEKMVQTDAEGAYEVELPPARYVVTARRYGYEDFPSTPMGGLVTVDRSTDSFDVNLERDPTEPTDIDAWQSVQLIGVVCQKVPEAPNPDPGLSWPAGFDVGGDG